MKYQIDKGSGNKQYSSDPNTVQIQISSGWLIGMSIFFGALILLGIFSSSF